MPLIPAAVQPCLARWRCSSGIAFGHDGNDNSVTPGDHGDLSVEASLVLMTQRINVRYFVCRVKYLIRIICVYHFYVELEDFSELEAA